MDPRELFGDFFSLFGIFRRHRTHADHIIPMETAIGFAGNGGPEHGDRGPQGHVADLYAVFQQGFFKRIAAANQESHHILRPVLIGILDGLFQFPVPVDVVPGNAAQDIFSRSQEMGDWNLLKDLQYRTGLRIQLGKFVKFLGIIPGQADQIRLDIPGRHAGSAGSDFSLADQIPDLLGRIMSILVFHCCILLYG